MTNAIVTELYEKSVRDKGLTYNVMGDIYPSTGYAVSVYPDREKIVHISDYNLATLQGYIADNVDLLSQRANCLGIWIDSDLVYLDISLVSDDLNYAVSAMREYNQIAIFDLGKLETVDTGKPETI
jgi:hypothetical protein